MNEKPQHTTPVVRAIPCELSIFIDRLAEDIVLGNGTSACAMCAIGSCRQHVSELVCQNAVKAWLLARAGEYLTVD